MNLILATATSPESLTDIPPEEDSDRSPLQTFCSCTEKKNNRGKRRDKQRIPCPQLVELTPIDAAGENLLERPIVVVGKSLSREVFGFFHQQPLPYRRVVATLDHDSGHRSTLLLDLTWCRFTRYGWYDSGSRILKIHSAPLG